MQPKGKGFKWREKAEGKAITGRERAVVVRREIQ